MSEIEANLALMRKWYSDDHQWKSELNFGYAWLSHDIVKSCIERNFHLNKFIPNKVDNLLEIAVGYGRATKIMQSYSNNLYGIDLNQNCVDYCKEQFSNGIFEITDGTSIPFGNILFDIIFSFDSLVHAEPKIIETYTIQIAERLKPNGIAMIHHSCSGVNIIESMSGQELGFGVGNRTSMTKNLMVEFCNRNCLKVLSQEDAYLLPNGNFNDTFTVLQKA